MENLRYDLKLDLTEYYKLIEKLEERIKELCNKDEEELNSIKQTHHESTNSLKVEDEK